MKNREKFLAVIKIIILMLVSYIIMVFISHFSVYGDVEGYSIKDSFDATLFKTDITSEFFRMLFPENVC